MKKNNKRLIFFIVSLIIYALIIIFGILAYFEKINILGKITCQREMWHIISFFAGIMFVMSINFLQTFFYSKIYAKNNFIVLNFLIFIVAIFISLDQEILHIFSKTNFYNHLVFDFIGIVLAGIFNFILYKKSHLYSIKHRKTKKV